MRCVEFERKVQDLLDENPQDTQWFESLPGPLSVHAAECARCREVLSGYRTMLVGLATLTRPQSSNELVERVVAETTMNVARRRTLPTWAATLATAASIAIILGGMALSRYRHASLSSDESLQPISAQSTVTNANPVHSTAIQSQTVMPLESLVSYPRRLELDQTSVEMVLNLAGFRPVTYSAEVLGSHWNQQPAWMAEVADGLKPVTESMSGTFNALLRVSPESAPPQDPNQGARNNRYYHYDRIG